MVRKLIPLEQIIEDSEREGINPSRLVADPDDIREVNPDEILALEKNQEKD